MIQTSANISWIYVPETTIELGQSELSDDERGKFSKHHVVLSPPRRVHLDAFEMMEYPVTQEVVAHVLGKAYATRLSKCDLLRPGQLGTLVSLAEAAEVARCLGGALPSEDQWEAAATLGIAVQRLPISTRPELHRFKDSSDMTRSLAGITSVSATGIEGLQDDHCEWTSTVDPLSGWSIAKGACTCGVTHPYRRCELRASERWWNLGFRCVRVESESPDKPRLSGAQDVNG